MSIMYLKIFALLVVSLFIIADNADKIDKRKIEFWSVIVSTFGTVLQLIQISITLRLS